CVRYLAQHVAEGDTRKMNATIGSCAGLYLILGAGTLAIGLTLSLAFVAIYDIPPLWRAQAPVAFAVMALQVAAGFIGLLPEGILFAHHDFMLRNLVRIAGVLVRLVLTIGLLRLRASLVLLALVQLACLAFDFTVSLAVIRTRYPDVRIRLADFDWSMVRRI